jgi:hypothetical protein
VEAITGHRGGVLITLGVAGELAVQFVASRKETELRKANDATFAALNIEAAQARKDAGEAVERAAQAELKTEEERLARLRLEQEIAPRRITPKQRIFLVSCLGSHRGERMYLVGQGGQDPEIEIFGKQLESLLRSVGFESVRFNPMNMPGAIGDASFTLSAGKDRAATANLMARCFKRAGLAFTAIKQEPSDQPTALGILVGYKQR